MSRSYRKNLIWKHSDKEWKRLSQHKLRQHMKSMTECYGKVGTYRRIGYEDFYCDFDCYIGWNSEREWKHYHRPYYESEKELHAAFMRIWKTK